MCDPHSAHTNSNGFLIHNANIRLIRPLFACVRSHLFTSTFSVCSHSYERDQNIPIKIDFAQWNVSVYVVVHPCPQPSPRSINLYHTILPSIRTLMLMLMLKSQEQCVQMIRRWLVSITQIHQNQSVVRHFHYVRWLLAVHFIWNH